MTRCTDAAIRPISWTAAASAIMLSLFTCLLMAKDGYAKDPESIGKLAKEMSVRIDGVIQGSGLLIEKTKTGYKVLTTWNVLREQEEKGELDIITNDGKVHVIDGFSISRIPGVDLATATFVSNTNYAVAQIREKARIRAGESVFVYGYPLPTSAVGERVPRFLKGELIANATAYIKEGYQLIYSNSTLPGMSGGPILDQDGYVIGIHGRGEADLEIMNQVGIATKNVTNLGVPISYFKDTRPSIRANSIESIGKNYDDYIVMAELAYREDNYEGLRDLARQAVRIKKSVIAYYYLAHAHRLLGEKAKSTIASYRGLTIQPKTASDYYWRGSIKTTNSINFVSAYKEFKVAYAMEPSNRNYALSYALFSPGLEGVDANISIINHEILSGSPSARDVVLACRFVESKLDDYPKYVSKGLVMPDPLRAQSLRKSFQDLRSRGICN